MKRLLQIVPLLLATVSLHAGLLGDDGWWCGKFWVAGEAVLWRPAVPAQYYTILGPVPVSASNDGAKGKQINLCPSYEWGYLVEIGYRVCDTDIRVNWASLNTTFRSKTTANASEVVWLTAGVSFPSTLPEGLTQGTAIRQQSFEYDVLDGEVSFWRHRECSKLSSRMFAGLRYARIESRQITRYIDVNGVEQSFYRLHSDNQGTGPRAGLALHYDLWCGLGFNGSLAGNLLVGSSKGRVEQEGQTVTERSATRVRNQSYCQIIPALDVRFGFDYRLNLCCWGTVFGEAGYQISQYWNGYSNNVYPESSEQVRNFFTQQSFSIDGFYFRLGAEF